MASSSRWLHGAPVGPLNEDSPGTQRWWGQGIPAALLGSLYAVYYATGVVAISVGCTATYSFESVTPAIVTQAVVETATADASPAAVVTQAIVETATVPATGQFRVTQIATETLSTGGEELRLTQIAVETLSQLIGETNVTQAVVETLSQDATPETWVTQTVVETLSSMTVTREYAGITAISIGLPFTYHYESGSALRASQVIVEAFSSGPGTTRVSQVVPEVFSSGPGTTRASQIIVEIFSKVGLDYSYAGTTAITFDTDSEYEYQEGYNLYEYEGITPITFGVEGSYFLSVAHPYDGITPITFGVQSAYRVERADIDWHYNGITPITIGAPVAYYPTSRYYSGGATPIDINTASLTYPLPFNLLATQLVAEVASQETPEISATQAVLEVATRWYVDPCEEPDVGEDLANVVGPLVWAEWLPGDGTTRPYAEMDLPDPATYHAGYKAGRLLSVSVIRRALAGPGFDYETGRFDVTLADTERDLRALLAEHPTSKWTGRFLAVYMVSDAGRRVGAQPRLIGYGVVSDDLGLNGLQLTLRAVDFVGSQLWTQTE
jgi:hypothetical protein